MHRQKQARVRNITYIVIEKFINIKLVVTGEAMGRGDTLWSKKPKTRTGTGNERENDS